MADLKTTPGGTPHQRRQMYRDEGDGTHSEDRSALTRAWNAVTLAYQRLTVNNADGGLEVHITGSDVSSAGGTSSADGATYTAGTTAGTPLMGARDDTSPGTVAEDKLGIARITTNRAVHVNLRDAAGAEVAVGGGTQYTEDAAAAADPVGTALNLVRKDTLAAVTDTDGDNLAARGTNKGELYVKHVDAIPVTDNGGSLTVDGSVSVAAALPAGTNNIGDIDIASIAAGDNNIGNVDVVTLPSLPAGTNNIGDVDVLTLPALPAGTNNIGDVDIASALPAGANTIGAVTPIPLATGGLDIFRSLDLDETEEEVKATAGTLYGWYIANLATTTRFVKFYNATAATVVVGTTTPVMTLPIPGNSTDDIAANLLGGVGIKFDTAITVAATTGVADADTGAPGANDVVINLFFK